MDDFALAILQERPTPVAGVMGRQDVKILQAIYRSMENGRKDDDLNLSHVMVPVQ
jgi:hypothetical protein